MENLLLGQIYCFSHILKINKEVSLSILKQISAREDMIDNDSRTDSELFPTLFSALQLPSSPIFY